MRIFYYLFLLFVTLFSASSFAADNQKTDKETKNKAIKVELVSKKQSHLEASISKTEEAKKLGLDKVKLVGKENKTTKKGANRKEVEIWWNKVKFNNHTAELKEPFVSKIIVDPKVKKGDKFAARGDIDDLLKKLNEVKNKKDDSQKSEIDQELAELQKKIKDKQSNANSAYVPSGSSGSGSGSSGSSGSSSTSNNEFDDIGPTIEVDDPEILSTQEGCEVRIDLLQNVAIVQERILEDGVEISGCADTEIRYPLVRDYNKCTNVIHRDLNKVYKQYTLNYTSPSSGGQIQVQDCVQDDDNYTLLEETTIGCGLRHDVASSLSFEQTRIVYNNDDGMEVVVDDCQDSGNTYNHYTTYNGCEDEVNLDNDIATLFSKKYIEVGDAIIEISDCSPNSTKNIQEEICNEGSRYYHDFNNNQSHYSKSYYYLKEGDRIDVATCVKSDSILEHKEDSQVCQMQHDDVSRATTIYGKIYIEDESNNVYISDCQSIGLPIPYAQIDTKLLKGGTSTNEIGIGTPNLITSVDSRQSSRIFTFRVRDCYDNQLAPYGTTDDGRVLTTQYIPDFSDLLASDNPVSYVGTHKVEIPNWISYDVTTDKVRKFGPNGTPEVNSRCKKPRCYVTTINKHPIYLRGDASEYLDTQTILEELHVCGDGNYILELEG